MTLPSDSGTTAANAAGKHQGEPLQVPPRSKITGVVLAGGLGRRMGGKDKGLLEINGRPLITHIIDILRPQVGSVLINANRNLDSYRGFGLPVVQDMVGEFCGPLAGMASALQASDTPYLLTVPCDSPLLPVDLCTRLYRALTSANAEISAAHDGSRMQPMFALLRREVLQDLLVYLKHGGRKTDTWYTEHRFILVDFSDRTEAFLNINTPAEWHTLKERMKSGETG